MAESMTYPFPPGALDAVFAEVDANHRKLREPIEAAVSKIAETWKPQGCTVEKTGPFTLTLTAKATS